MRPIISSQHSTSVTSPTRPIETKAPIAWVIGDIHGCFNELRRLEEKIASTCERLKRKPIFVSVGDMVDRGPDSYSVVEHFRKGVLAGTHAAVAGNHEALMLRTLYHERADLFEPSEITLPYWVERVSEFLYGRPAYQRWGSPNDWIRFNRLNWTSQGGGEALESYGCNAANPDTWNIPSDHVAFLCGLPLLWQDHTCVVTHALAQALDIHQLKHGRRLDPVGQYHTLWSRSLPRERPEFKRVHVSGHTPMRRVQRKRHLGIVRVDLGAFGGGRLGAYCPELDRSVSVQSRVIWMRGG